MYLLTELMLKRIDGPRQKNIGRYLNIKDKIYDFFYTE